MMSRFMKACVAFVLTIGLGNAALADGHEGCNTDPEQLQKTGTIKGHVDSVGWLVGARWGNGVLTLTDGTERKFSLFGMKVLETGLAANDFEGDVFNLKSVEDFPGTFYGGSTKLSLLVSKGEGVFNNKRCVVVSVRASGGGLQLSAPGAAGVEVKFTD